MLELGLEVTTASDQNAVTHMQMAASRLAQITLILQDLHWPLITFHAQFKLPFLTYDRLHCLGAGPSPPIPCSSYTGVH